MRKKVTEKQKKSLIYLCSLASFLENKENFEEWEDYRFRISIDKLNKAFNDVIRYSNADGKTMEDITKDVKTGVYRLDIFTNIELKEKMKRNLKTRRKVDGESILTLAEYSMGEECINCDKNKKACRLRKALLKAEIPELNEKRGECGYKQSK